MANPFQQLVRGVIRGAINEYNGKLPEKPITSPIKGSESWYRDRLAKELNGRTEVNTPVGRIDILTKTQIIEVKRVSGWKAAKGQVKAYGHYYPKHKLRIHLFGEMTETKLKTIQEHCKAEGIILTWE